MKSDESWPEGDLRQSCSSPLGMRSPSTDLGQSALVFREQLGVRGMGAESG